MAANWLILIPAMMTKMQKRVATAIPIDLTLLIGNNRPVENKINLNSEVTVSEKQPEDQPDPGYLGA